MEATKRGFAFNCAACGDGIVVLAAGREEALELVNSTGEAPGWTVWTVHTPDETPFREVRCPRHFFRD